MDPKRSNILIVDDSREDRETFRRMLGREKECPFIVAEVDCGEDGLRQCISNPPDCVILDYNLKDIDGLEFLSRVRSETGDKAIPIIFLTGTGSEAVAAEAMKQGAYDYLVKGDVAAEDLRRAIHKAIEKAALQCKIEQQRKELNRQAIELRESEERFRAFMDNSPGVAWIKDEEGRYVYVSKTYERRFGVELDNFRGKTDFELWPLTAAQTSRSNDIAVLSDGQTREVMEETHDSNGVPSFWWNFKFLIRDAAGGKYVAGFGVDVTERNRLEVELQRSIERLEAADHRKDEFLAMLGHELRNPLASISNGVKILRRTKPADPTLDRVTEIIDQQLAHMARLVDDLLDASRISQGKISLQEEPLEVTALIERVVATSRPLIEAHRHTLTVTMPAQPLHIEGDPVRLIQVIGNLLDNAAKYTDDGGQIWLEAEVGPRLCVAPSMRGENSDKGEDNHSPSATFVSSKGEQDVIIRVRDTGKGISPEFLPHVFDMFTQAEHALDRPHGGLGIGLTLAKKLAELHGGGISVRSAGSGQGSEFILRLPKAETALSPEPSPIGAKRDATPTDACRILVVDDNVAVAESMTMLLRLDNYEVQVAHDGPAALAAAQTFKPQVVLLDIGLPAMDGYEVARRLRALPEGRDILLIALTGYGRHEDRLQCEAAGFDNHFIKPADIDTLKDLIEARASRLSQGH